MLAGVLPMDAALSGRWPQAQGWQLPVGAPDRLGAPALPGEPAFQQNRGVEREGQRVVHQGADLADGRAGDPVRAAASGIVALAFDGDNGDGYGGHVVIAHRLDDGRTVFTVYAHLAAGSVEVSPGDVIAAGDPIGRVGQTGRASTPHLHFEVRLPASEDERWETSPVVDPVAFVLEHAHDAAAEPDAAATAEDAGRGGSGLEAYVRWAVRRELFVAPADTSGALTRSCWWTMLARVTGTIGAPDAAPIDEQRDRLVAAGVLPREAAGVDAAGALPWPELARDVGRLRKLHLEYPHGPLAKHEHEASCRASLGQRSPAAHARALRRLGGSPTLAEACLVLADLGGPRSGTTRRRRMPHA
ncbi:MAG TPA: M23 family metallopeptidase [Candidatus Acidoferrales bacterium]|nr:M23 family metallopeptidase [Candidatus Acidoferrales bacterium]